MVSLTPRQSKMIRLLLNRNDFITISDISNLFDISPRTTRNDLLSIRVFLEEHGFSLKSVPNKGTKILAEKEDIAKIEQLMLANRNFTEKERNDLIILKLLCDDRCTYESLAQSADVSRYTVVHNIDDIEKKLKDFDLNLIRNKGKGIFLSGRESDFRRTFAYIINDNDYRSDLFRKVLSDVCNKENSAKATQMIDAVEGTLKLSFFDIDRLSIVLSYGLYRISSGNTIEKNEEVKKELSRYIRSLSVFGLSRNEDIYFASVFKNSKVRNLDKKAEEGGISQTIARFLMEELDRLHSLNSEEKEKFLLGLTSHLDVALYRIRNDVPIRNGLRDQIRICLPLTYDFTKKQLLKCEEEYGISFNEDEIAYITMYVGSTYETSIKLDNQISILLVCSIGMTTSSILEARIKQLLPDCLFVGPFSRKEAIRYLEKNEVDLIISTNDEEYGDTKTIVVNPLLYKQDIDYIRAQLFEINYDKMCSSFLDSYASMRNENRNVTHLKDLIPEKNIQIVDGVDSWRDSIRIAAKPLLKDKKINEEYVERMISVVEEFGTYMVILPNTAFVHAGNDDGIREECCSLLVMRKPLVFGDKNPKTVRNIVVVGVKKKEKMLILDLADILSRKENLNYLRSADVSVEGIGELSD